MKRSRERLENEIAFWEHGLTYVWLATVLTPLGIWGWQIWTWLRHGYLHQLAICDVMIKFRLPFPSTEWIGVQRIIYWLLSWPAAVAAILLGMALVLLLSALINRARDQLGASA